MREVAIALFQQERITLNRASKITGIDLMKFQTLLAEHGICVHYDVELDIFEVNLFFACLAGELLIFTSLIEKYKSLLKRGGCCFRNALLKSEFHKG